MVGLIRLAETQRQHALELLLLAVEGQVVGVIAVVPRLRIEQRQLALAQKIDQRGDIGVPPQILRISLLHR